MKCLHLSSSSSSSPMASSIASFIISSFMSMISLCRSNSIMIFWIWGSFSCGEGRNMRLAAREAYCWADVCERFSDRPVCSWWPWLWWRPSSPEPCCCWIWASESLDWRPECWLSSWWTSWRSAACEPDPWPWSWRRPAKIQRTPTVRTLSLEMTLTISLKTHVLCLRLTICPCLAIFFMSAMIFFSCCSSFIRSRSSSLMARLSALWFCFSISSGVFLLPNRKSICLTITRAERQSSLAKQHLEEKNIISWLTEKSLIWGKLSSSFHILLIPFLC